MNRVFGTAPLSGEAWLRILALGLATSVVIGVEKWLRRRMTRGGAPPEGTGPSADGIPPVRTRE